MSRRLLVAAIVIVVVVLGGARVAAASSEPPPPSTVPTTANDFLPQEQDVTDCVSALPPPDCGSPARGGWAQTAIFIGVGLALGFIAWRIVRAMRRGRRATDDETDHEGTMV